MWERADCSSSALYWAQYAVCQLFACHAQVPLCYCCHYNIDSTEMLLLFRSSWDYYNGLNNATAVGRGFVIGACLIERLDLTEEQLTSRTFNIIHATLDGRKSLTVALFPYMLQIAPSHLTVELNYLS